MGPPMLMGASCRYSATSHRKEFTLSIARSPALAGSMRPRCPLDSMRTDLGLGRLSISARVRTWPLSSPLTPFGPSSLRRVAHSTRHKPLHSPQHSTGAIHDLESSRWRRKRRLAWPPRRPSRRPRSPRTHRTAMAIVFRRPAGSPSSPGASASCRGRGC